MPTAVAADSSYFGVFCSVRFVVPFRTLGLAVLAAGVVSAVDRQKNASVDVKTGSAPLGFLEDDLSESLEAMQLEKGRLDEARGASLGICEPARLLMPPSDA